MAALFTVRPPSMMPPALFDLRRRSILELARQGIAGRRSRGLGGKAHARRDGAKLRELEIWVAELDGVAAAWGAIRGDTLEGLYTAPEFAGRGVASGMLAWLEALMRCARRLRPCTPKPAQTRGILSSPGLPDERTANGRWRVADHEGPSIDACKRGWAEVLAEVSARSLSRLRRLIFPAQGATLAAELTGLRGPQNWLFGGFGVADQVHDLTPEEVSKGIEEGRYLLVDVREPNEVAVEAYPCGVVVPLSTFDPKAIPDPQGQAGGVRLPLGQALGDGLAGGAGRGPCLRQAPRRRHHRLEGRGPADQGGRLKTPMVP